VVDKKLVGPGSRTSPRSTRETDRPPKDSHKKSRQGAAVYGPDPDATENVLMPSANELVAWFLGLK